jgi:hypothetical protein
MPWTCFRWHDILIYRQNFMKIGTDVLAILRLSLRNLKSCKVGIMVDGIYEY